VLFSSVAIIPAISCEDSVARKTETVFAERTSLTLLTYCSVIENEEIISENIFYLRAVFSALSRIFYFLFVYFFSFVFF